MSSESDVVAANPLKPVQRRILGVLAEKAFTTDTYPLTSNAVITGCNQKSNREPVSRFEPHEVDEALIDLKQAGLVIERFSEGSRVGRFKHHLYEAWDLDRPQLAVLAELFLRGPQAEGDLRARASRMAPLESLDALRAILNRLAERGFVRRPSPDGRKRGVMWGHLFLSDREKEGLDRIAEREESQEDDEPSSPEGPSSGPSLRDQVRQLDERVALLESMVKELVERPAS